MINRDGATYYSGGISAVYVFMLVAGVVCLAQTFPFAISLSVSRKDYFLGTTAIAGLLSAMTAFGIWLLTLAERATNGWGDHLIFFDIPFVNDGSILQPLWISFVLLTHMFLLGFFCGAIFQRFRMVGFFAVSVASLAIVSLATYLATRYQWWGAIWQWISGQSAFQLSLWFVLVSAIYFVASYLMLRRTPV